MTLGIFLYFIANIVDYMRSNILYANNIIKEISTFETSNEPHITKMLTNFLHHDDVTITPPSTYIYIITCTEVVSCGD